MRILVLGGGIAGVTAAYFLARDGHAVTLVEEQEGVGRDASAANAGIIAPGHSFAWASPKAPAMLFRSLLGGETAIRVRPRLDQTSSPGASGSFASALPGGPGGTRSSSSASASTARQSWPIWSAPRESSTTP